MIEKKHHKGLSEMLDSLIYRIDGTKKALADLPELEDLYKKWGSKIPPDVIRYGRDRAVYALNGFKKTTC